MDFPPPFPLPLADAEDVFKVVIGVVFAIIWIVAQVAASGSAAKKKREQARLAEALQVQPAPATLSPMPPPGSYDELRRRRQGVQTRPQPQPHQTQRQHKPQRPRREPVAVASPVAAKRPVPVVNAAIPDAISRTEIAGNGLAQRRAEKGPRVRRVRALVRPGSARDVVIAAELLGTPVALRQGG